MTPERPCLSQKDNGRALNARQSDNCTKRAQTPGMVDGDESRSSGMPTEAESCSDCTKQKSESTFTTVGMHRNALIVCHQGSFCDKVDSESMKTEMEMIQILDIKLQELEEKADPLTCSSKHILLEENKGIPTAILYLRNERKKWRRQQRLKRTLEKLDMTETQNRNKHILRNVRLERNARYFTLTQDEESLLEDLLLREDCKEEEIADGNSISSCMSTGFDVEGEDALRMAEIDEKLEQFIEIHSACGSPSITSVGLSLPKQCSVHSQTPSIGFNVHGQNGDELTGGKSFTTAVEDYLAEKKERREHQAKVESIDKRLRELMIAHTPRSLNDEQLSMLVFECMKEQSLEAVMRPSCIKT